MLLHLGGSALQGTYFLLPGSSLDPVRRDDEPYQKCIEALDRYYAPKLNVLHEAYVFFEMRQRKEERFENFLQRLREQAERCETGAELTKWMLRVRIVGGINSIDTRSKLLEKEYSLDRIINICRNDETLKDNLRAYNDTPSYTASRSTTEVNRITNAQRDKAKDTGFSREKLTCFNCGKKGHIAKDGNCPAKGKQCQNCAKLNHL